MRTSTTTESMESGEDLLSVMGICFTHLLLLKLGGELWLQKDVCSKPSSLICTLRVAFLESQNEVATSWIWQTALDKNSASMLTVLFNKTSLQLCQTTEYQEIVPKIVATCFLFTNFLIGRDHFHWNMFQLTQCPNGQSQQGFSSFKWREGNPLKTVLKHVHLFYCKWRPNFLHMCGLKHGLLL